MMIETLDALGRRMTDPELLDVIGSAAEGLVIKNITSGNWAPNAPLTQAIKGNNKPLRDMGNLMGSIAHRVEGDRAVVGTNHIAARLLHYGGEVTAKKAQFLAIPAGRETRTFMRQYGLTPRTCIEGMKSAGYQIWIAKSIVMARKGKTGKPRALFLLRRSVHIPARPFMTLGEQGRTVLSRMVARRVFG
jgi:phage gpG-like protein